VIGAAALALRGVGVASGDIDIVTDERGALLLAEVYRAEPVFPVMELGCASRCPRKYISRRQ
jgi:hypothetical protein